MPPIRAAPPDPTAIAPSCATSPTACGPGKEGRANPHQLLMTEATLADIAALRAALVDEHRQHFGRTDDLLVGLQLTHSGRFARPHDKQRLEPRILYRHPVLDRKFHVPAGQP